MKRLASVPRVPLADIGLSVHSLVASNQLDVARRTLEFASDAAKCFVEHEILAGLVEDLPGGLVRDPLWAGLFARVWCNARRAQPILERLNMAEAHGRAHARLSVFRAWALVQTERFGDALNTLESVWDGLPEDLLGLAWRVRGTCLGQLGRSDWLESFARARGLLRDRSLGLCLLEQGNQFELLGDGLSARRVYSEALALLSEDVYYTAWLHHNLGVSCTRAGLFHEAETHYLEMQRLTRREGARTLRPVALLGLGLTRRAFGEWGRALEAYRAATRIAADGSDQRQAWRGLGHTLRLSGEPGLALEPLERAARLGASDLSGKDSWVHADLAAAHLMRSDDEAACDALEHTGLVRGEDADRVRIVRAELRRRTGEANAAIHELEGLRFDAFWTREERDCFPQLFALGAAMGLPDVQPLSRPTGILVEVCAIGLLEVKVNRRDVPLKPTGRAGEVLVLLLERDGQATVEDLLVRLYPHQTSDRQERRRKTQALSVFVRELREALGWSGSVRSLGGAYRLDPGANWAYDVARARDQGQRVTRFLEGVYQEWALETGLILRGGRNPELN